MVCAGEDHQQPGNHAERWLLQTVKELLTRLAKMPEVGIFRPVNQCLCHRVEQE